MVKLFYNLHEINHIIINLKLGSETQWYRPNDKLLCNDYSLYEQICLSIENKDDIENTPQIKTAHNIVSYDRQKNGSRIDIDILNTEFNFNSEDDGSQDINVYVHRDMSGLIIECKAYNIDVFYPMHRIESIYTPSIE